MKKRNLILYLFAGVIFLFVAGCNPMKKYEKEEKEQIDRYLMSIGDTVYVKEPSGLYYLEIEEGTGNMPVQGDSISFWYKVKFLDGRLFDSNINLDEPVSFVKDYGQLILGVEEGLQYMKEGGKSKFLTPSFLAYGSQGIWGVLAGYTPLVWDIELVRVKSNTK